MCPEPGSNRAKPSREGLPLTNSYRDGGRTPGYIAKTGPRAPGFNAQTVQIAATPRKGQAPRFGRANTRGGKAIERFKGSSRRRFEARDLAAQTRVRTPRRQYIEGQYLGSIDEIPDDASDELLPLKRFDDPRLRRRAKDATETEGLLWARINTAKACAGLRHQDRGPGRELRQVIRESGRMTRRQADAFRWTLSGFRSEMYFTLVAHSVSELLVVEVTDGDVLGTYCNQLAADHLMFVDLHRDAIHTIRRTGSSGTAGRTARRARSSSRGSTDRVHAAQG